MTKRQANQSEKLAKKHGLESYQQRWSDNTWSLCVTWQDGFRCHYHDNDRFREVLKDKLSKCL